MQMTDEQRQLAEDNINLVYRFMIDYHLNPDVYYDLLMIELCRAAMVYNKNSGNTFSTLAYSYFLNLVKNVIKKDKSEKNGGTINIISMDKMFDDENSCLEAERKAHAEADKKFAEHTKALENLYNH